jgi:hypothetical protein
MSGTLPMSVFEEACAAAASWAHGGIHCIISVLPPADTLSAGTCGYVL